MTDALAAFLEQPLMCILAATDSEGRPTAGRGIGVEVVDDRTAIEVIFSSWQWPALETAIRETGRLAATFVTPADYVTYQLKGPAAVRDVVPGDLLRAGHFMARATGALEALGVPSSIIAPWLTDRGATAARLTIAEIYIQTPGPQAGMHAKAVP